jgi:hypothetical protein
MSGPSHQKRVERARAKWDKASRAVCDWAIANGHGHTRRSDLVRVAPAALIEADTASYTAWMDAENAAVAACKAWRGTFNLLFWY